MIADASLMKAMKRYLDKHPCDERATALLRPDPKELRIDCEWAWVQWRDDVEDFLIETRQQVAA